MSAWDKLSMFERADIMKLAVKSGVHNLDAIRNGYNKFAEGGSKKKITNTDEQYFTTMEKVAEDNYQKWGFSNPDEALLHALNDNTYNYRGYYNKYPNGKGNAVDHWPDEFKTVYHPTFSNESIYSSKKSQYNPLGLPGGFWSGDTFIPMAWQLDANEYKYGGGIHIDPSKKGTFTAAASKHGMGIQEFASKVLANKEDYSSAMVKKANFARNSKKWKHGEGGNLFSGEEKHSQQIATKPKQVPWYSELDEAVLGEVMQQFRNIAYPGNSKDVSYKGDVRGKNGGTAQRTYLLPRSEQEDIFLRDGYIKGKEGDYGLVKKAVNNRNLPVWQTKPDAVSRKTLVPIGNVYGWDYGYINRDKDLVHAGAHPTAFYVDGSTGKLYTKGWDLNDYGGTGGGQSSNYNILKKAGADILDFIGNPVVVTTGFQEVTNPWGGESSHLSKGATIQDLFNDDYYGASTVGKMLDDAMSKRGLHRENINDKWSYSLPEVIVTGKKRKK